MAVKKIWGGAEAEVKVEVKAKIEFTVCSRQPARMTRADGRAANCKLVTLFSTALDFFVSFFIKKKRKPRSGQRPRLRRSTGHTDGESNPVNIAS
jgi:hypothetical protein